MDKGGQRVAGESGGQRVDRGAADPRVLGADELEHEGGAGLAAGDRLAEVEGVETHGLAGGHQAHEVIGVKDVAAQRVVTDVRLGEAGEQRTTGIFGEGFAGEIRALAVRTGGRHDRVEGVVGLGAPRALRELVGLGEFRRWSAGDAQRLARDGVGQRVAGTPRDGVVVGAAEDAEGAVKAPGQLVVPAPVVHELAILEWQFLLQQAHRGAAPDFTDAAAGVTVEHAGGGVKAGQRGGVAGPGIDGVLAVWC